MQVVQKIFGPEDEDTTGRMSLGLECGFNFSLSLLKQIKNVDSKIMENSMDYLIQTLK